MNAQKLDVQGAHSFFRDQKVSLSTKLLGVLAVLYVVSPIDLIPDVIPFFGWLDDVGVLALVAAWFLREFSQRHEEPSQAAPPVKGAARDQTIEIDRVR